MMPLDRIRIQGVRGIRRELTLDLKGSSLVLRGDNGTGKSSIVAGLLWALRGEEAPVPGAKVGSEEAYRAHILDGAASSRVILDLAGNAGSITVTPTGIEVKGVGPQLRESCARSSPFLLRKQLLRFLDDRPVDRFKYLEAFLDLGQADETREALQGRSRSHEAAAEDHKKTRDRHL
jgi:recombinational DNA repair ATPase RecF